MWFLFFSLIVVVLLVFVVVALDPAEPDLIDLSALDDGGMLPVIVAERDRSIEELVRKSLLLDEAVLRFETAERKVGDLEGAQTVIAASGTPSRTYVAEISTVVALKEADPAESSGDEGGEGGSSVHPSPR